MQDSTNGNVAGLGCVFIFQQSCEWMISLMAYQKCKSAYKSARPRRQENAAYHSWLRLEISAIENLEMISR